MARQQCEAVGGRPLRFRFDGDPIDPARSGTPESLGMEDGDIVDVE